MSWEPSSIPSVIFCKTNLTFLPSRLSDISMSLDSTAYFIALSTRILMSCLIEFSSPIYLTPSSISVLIFLPFTSDSVEKWSITSCATSEISNSIFSFGSGFSSSLESATICFVKDVSLLTCFLVFWVHSLSPFTISITSIFASIIVRGVLISWLASVIKRFCFS